MNNLLSLFKIFNLSYFIYLLVAIVIAVVAILFLVKLHDEKVMKICKIVLVSAISLFVILEYIFRVVSVAEIKIGDMLPFELLEVMAFISIYTFFLPKHSLRKFAYLIIVPVTAYSLIITPNMFTLYESVSMAIICHYLLGATLVINSILNMIWCGEEIEKKDILDASITYVIVVAVVHLINIILQFTGLGIHANYMGTIGENYDVLLNLINQLIPVPFLYLFPFLAILVGVQFLLVLPFDLIKTKREKRSEVEELIALGNLKKQQEYRNKQRKSKTASQILTKSETKAMPSTPKNVKNKESDGFVKTTKEVQVNNDKSE